MKLIQTITNINDGIFHQLYQYYGDELQWLTIEKVNALDNDYYYGISGSKEITPLFKRLFMYGDIITNIIYERFSNKWNRLIQVLVDEVYNPIENYNMIENRKKKTDNTSDTKRSQNIETETGVNNGIYGFNSTSAVDSDESKSTQNVKSNLEDNQELYEGTSDENEELTRTGNIGVTTTQQMIMQELDLRKNNVYDIIIADVDSLLTLDYYKQD